MSAEELQEIMVLKDKINKNEKMKSKKIVAMKELLLAAEHLLLAATGPLDGPTNWEETKDNWIKLVHEVLNDESI